MNTPRGKSALDAFELYYEELEKKVAKPKSSKVQTSKPKPSKPVLVRLKLTAQTYAQKLKKKFDNVVKKVFSQRKKAKKLTKIEQKQKHEQNMRGILGIGLLFVVVSITYSTYVIFNGVSSTASRVMLIPQVVFAALTLYKAFSKIYK